ncbi:Class II abasic (AP) endonuclease [Tulasnella sp. 425]|nr:Class II abasic (AP) endonuclease [Tulasnella sp. 425]
MLTVPPLLRGLKRTDGVFRWYTLKTCEAILSELKADIMCFQEMKITRTALERPTALPGPYYGFFSFPVSKGGYSGVAVYADSRTAIPIKAEEGLTGILQPKPPLSEEERISSASSYPDSDDFNFFPEEDGSTPPDFATAEIDFEGRALVVDFGLFVLINVYCPAETSDSRLSFKMNFHRLLEKRVRSLIAEGREVIVVGDINIAATPLDHGEGSLASRQVGFYEHPPRAWYKSLLEPDGPMIDAVRKCHPGREGMYTHWSTLLSARGSNYGSRIDYILITEGLLPWFKFGDIQADILGSDHCPVYIDLHDEIVLPSGETRTLKSMMGMDSQVPRDPPRICAKFWDEFSGKQTLVSAFFTRKKEDINMVNGGGSKTNLRLPPAVVADSGIGETPATEPDIAEPSLSLSQKSSQKALGKRKQTPLDEPTVTKPTKKPPVKEKPSKKAKITEGQTKLSSFFAQASQVSKTLSTASSSHQGKSRSKSNSAAPTPPDTNASSTPAVMEIIDVDSDLETDPASSSQALVGGSQLSEVEQLEADLAFARSLAEEDAALVNHSPGKRKGDPSAWKSLLAPLEAPLCTVHKEPSKRFIVNKTGPNKGKAFYVCSRPVGPGYDKGRAERLREEVNPMYRCDFFKWASDVRRDAKKT